jgi:hypothetical protein
MALGEGLGRLFDVESNISRNSGNVKCVSLKDYGGVTFVCWVPAGGQDTFIVKAATAAVANSGSFTAFNPVSRYYNKALDDGTTVWTDSGDLTANLGTFVVLSGQLAFYVGADDLPAGDSYVQVVPGTSGIVTAIMHDPIVQRNPKYLRAPNS